MAQHTGSIQAALAASKPRLADIGFNREVTQAFTAGQDSVGGDFTKPAVKLERPNFTNAELFVASAFSAGTKEMIGSRPSWEVERFRSENPIAGVISWMVGSTPFFLLPQAGLIKAGSAALPGFTKALSMAEKLKGAGHAFKGGALAEATRFAPLEAGKVIGGAFNPEEGSFGRASAHAVSELGFLGVLGGVGSAVSKNLAHLKFERLKAQDPAAQLAMEKRVGDWIGPGFSRSDPVQAKWEHLVALRNRKNFDTSPIRHDVEQLIPRYETQIKISEPPRINKGPGKKDKSGKVTIPAAEPTRYVANMGSRAATQRVESLFEAGVEGGRGAKGIQSKIFKLTDPGEVGGYGAGEEAAAELGRALESWKAVTSKAGVGEIWQAITQFPRELVATSKQSMERMTEILLKDFRRIGDDTWYAQEGAEGLYVIVKKFKQQKPGQKNRFFIFKTNKPSKWLKNETGIHDTNARTYLANIPKWNRVEPVPDADVTILATMERIWAMENPELASLFQGRTRYSTSENISSEFSHMRLFWDKVMPESVQQVSAPMFDASKEIGRRAKIWLAPQRLQFANNARAQNHVMATMKLFEGIAAEAADITLGPISKKFIRGSTNTPLRSIFGNALKPDQRRTGGTHKLFEDLLNSEKSLKDFNQIRIAQLTPEKAAQLGLDPNAVKLAEELTKVDTWMAKRIADQARALGMEAALVPQEGHMAIANTWLGHYRVRLVDATSNDVVGFASGFSKPQAAEEAIRITEMINKASVARGEGKKLLTYSEFEGKSADLIIGNEVLHGGSEQAFKEMTGLKALSKELGLEAAATDASARQADIFGFATQINLHNNLVESIRNARASLYQATPKRFSKSKKLLGGGFTGGTPFSVQDLKTIHSAGIVESLRYMGREAVAHGPMSDAIKRLAVENAGDAITFNRIFNSLNGVSGPVSRAIEKGIDAVLADVVGPGVAMKMVRSTNEAMFLLTLGSFDMGFAALNMITPLQTALPEVAFILGAAPETLQRYYSNTLVKTIKGVRPASFMDTAKFAQVAASDLLRPDKATREALARAFDEHVVGRDFVETVHGTMRNIVEGEGGAWRTFQRWSEAPIVATEEASRAYSFLLGRRVAQDFFGMAENESFQFARQFVQHTMFGYGAADRPRILTGALGAGWGLFKNWTMNYTGNLLRYSAEASRGHFNPLMWAGATTGAVGGLSGMPLAGMADNFSRWAVDKPMNDLIYDMIGNDPGDHTKAWSADFLAHGFPSLLGMTLRSRASAPSSHMMTDITMWANIAMLDRTVALGESIGTFMEDAFDFRIPMQNPKFRRELLRAFAPRTLQRAVTGFANDGLMSLKTGNSLMPALNIREATLHSFGLTPIRVANTFEIQQEAWADVKAKKELTQLLGRRMADATLNRDWEEVRRIQAEATEGAVLIDSVNSSAMNRIRNQTEPFLSRQFRDRITQQRIRNRGY